jgi:hypothetical protein
MRMHCARRPDIQSALEKGRSVSTERQVAPACSYDAAMAEDRTGRARCPGSLARLISAMTAGAPAPIRLPDRAFEPAWRGGGAAASTSANGRASWLLDDFLCLGSDDPGQDVAVAMLRRSFGAAPSWVAATN